MQYNKNKPIFDTYHENMISYILILFLKNENKKTFKFLTSLQRII